MSTLVFRSWLRQFLLQVVDVLFHLANVQVLATFAVHVLAFAMCTALGKVKGMIVQIQQGMHGGIALHDDGPAIAPIAAIRSPARDKLLTAKAQATVAALATAHQDFGLINDIWPFQDLMSFLTPGWRYTGECTRG